MNNDNSGVNTILIVIVLVILVGGGIWWYKSYGPGVAPAEDTNNGLEINIGGGDGAPNEEGAGAGTTN